MQVEEWLTTFGVPSACANQFWEPVKEWLVSMTARSPSRSTIVLSFWAISVRAWSQEISSNSPEPRSPLRFRGFLMRMGWFHAHMVWAPRPQ